MPAFDDFLLREIERFAAAIGRVVGAREEDDEAVEEAIADGLRSLVGLTVETLARMPADAVRPLFMDGERLEADKAITVAWLLHAAAALRPAGEAHQLRVAALGVHALALETGPLGPESAEQLEGLARAVHLRTVPAATLSRLIPYFERVQRFDRAEDVVFALIEVDRAAGLDAGRTLYERLWALPDARLQAGGLSSQEVLEGLAELERRAAQR